MRSGAEILESLRDGRQVVIDGQVVKDVTGHPAFAGVCRTMAGLYDRIAAERDTLTIFAGDRPAGIHRAPGAAVGRRAEKCRLGRLNGRSQLRAGRAGPEHVASFSPGSPVAEVFARRGGVPRQRRAISGQGADEHL